ncbi:hypothetical protein CISIN_1g043058mg [Citrus sinensis]|uniref:Uncharacterized protein n=1 Tax=Citrus sinensis TaxID=2711 RepID=A0A067GWV5_CITSI|nr:hypothetical protein CISIN_1g043058mg [Citrus sinensis]
MVGNCEICASGSQITYLPFHSCSGQVFLFIGALARSLVQLGNWKLVTVCGGSNNNLKLNCKVTNYMNCFLNLRHTSFLIVKSFCFVRVIADRILRIAGLNINLYPIHDFAD